MRSVLLPLFIAFVLFVSPAARAQDSGAMPGSFADLSAGLVPAVVNISSTQKAISPEDMPDMPHFPPGSPFEDFFEEFMNRQGGEFPSVPASALGSGFIIDAEKGFIVTNAHVIEDAENVRVTFHDDSTVDAEIVGRDEKMDIAVLKVKPEDTKKFNHVDFGDSDSLRVGDWILAIGNPFGLGGTVTAGIVSAQQRNINAGPYDDFIQTDASINRGNSGGPMFNLKGEVIGINTAIYSPSGGSVGIGFAIPANLAKPVIRQLIDFGHTRRGWLGVKIQNVTPEIAESLGLEKEHGALIASVTAGGPAEKAGLEAGDIILQFNGKEVNAMRNLPRIVAETPIGEKADIVYWRDGGKKTTSVEVGELEKAEEDGLLGDDDKNGKAGPGKSKKGLVMESLGLTLNAIGAQDREEYKIPDDIKGVLVTAVADNSEAAEKGLVPGDVVVEVNQQAVEEPKDVSELVQKALNEKRSSVLLLINRKGDVRFVALKLKNKKE